MQRMESTAVEIEQGAEAFLPSPLSLPALRKAATTCRGCPLYRNATAADD